MFCVLTKISKSLLIVWPVKHIKCIHEFVCRSISLHRNKLNLADFIESTVRCCINLAMKCATSNHNISVLYQNSNFAPTISLFTFHASKLARGSRGLFRIINEKHRKNWNSKIVCRFYREVARSKPQIGLNKMLCSHHIPYILIVQTLKHCLCVSLRERERMRSSIFLT